MIILCIRINKTMKTFIKMHFVEIIKVIKFKLLN